ncbi:hypothetical protein M407DRAFT_28260 [Tulasnella calospora MUT 4182]|uniref:Uncharacterized protein n=1 Tax=Tulasnella calospora MUT 4182 TaxID=1051891 RepID=A0A0C3KL59_9AGAM|nr:hypothetical protein M407DRAFT_28260 [Tulasnella calospora MUT 4182]
MSELDLSNDLHDHPSPSLTFELKAAAQRHPRKRFRMSELDLSHDLHDDPPLR